MDEEKYSKWGCGRQNRNRLTDIVNKLVVPSGEREGGVGFIGF